MVAKLKEYVKMEGPLACKTGVRIGGSKEEIEIGGLDNPIIRDPLSKLPYIPGSSLKGKLRSLLEYKEGKIREDGKPCGCGKADCKICKVFGPHSPQHEFFGPSRIIVRDAKLTKQSIEKLKKLQEEGLMYTELKAENIIDRKTGRAGDLRTMERVPAGAEFGYQIVLRIFEPEDNRDELVNFVKQGLELLAQDYLGGSGTRGYGWVEVGEPKIDIYQVQG